jgi:small subunit ribosomal protein S2
MTKVTPKFTIKQLLEAGVHFGHKTSRRNPKMAPYIYGIHNNLHIIDLQKTAPMLAKALQVIEQISKENGKILFVGTKKQAADIVAEEAKRCGQYYVNNRWLGGMLTNWTTVSKSIKKLKKIEEDIANEDIKAKKKEKLMLDKQRQKLEKNFGGIRSMGNNIQLIIVVDTRRENLAIKEAQTLGIPVMAIIDTNSSPEGIDYLIPGNDDSIKAIRLYFRLFSDSVLEGIKKSMDVIAADKKSVKPIIRKDKKDEALKTSETAKRETLPAKKSKEKVPTVAKEEKAPAVVKEAKVPAEKAEIKVPAKKVVAKVPTKKVVAKVPTKKVEKKKAPAKKAPAKKPATK